jgi:hypothetical protein
LSIETPAPTQKDNMGLTGEKKNFEALVETLTQLKTNIAGIVWRLRILFLRRIESTGRSS